VEQYYSLSFNQPVIAELKEGVFALRRYSPGYDGYREKSFRVNKRDLTDLARLFEKNCRSYAMSGQFPFLKNYLNTVVLGDIDFTTKTCLVVNVQSGFASKVLGVCEYRFLPPIERKDITKSSKYFVKKIGLYEGQPALLLSRVCRHLVEKLFEELGYKVCCIRRIAGAKSDVLSPKYISPKHIKLVSDELKERVIVRYK
jgi:hypothetical protein